MQTAFPVLLGLLVTMAALVLSPGQPRAGDGPNLLRNGQMEPASPDGGIRNWTAHVWEGAGETAAKPVRQNQKVAAVIANAGRAKQAILQELVLQPCTYRLKALVAGQELQPGTYGLTTAVHIAFDDKRTITKNLVPAGDTAWSVMELTFHVPAAAKTIVYFFNYGSGQLFVADVELTPDRGCRPGADVMAPLVATGETVAYAAPRMPSDDLLAGYCGARDFADRLVCRAIAAARSAPGAPGPQTSSVNAAPGPAPQMLENFENLSLWSRLQNVGGPRAIAGKSSGLITPDRYLALDAPGIIAADWRGYDLLRFEVFNPGPAARPIGIEIWDGKTTGYWSRVNWSTFAAPGLSMIEVPLQIYVGEKSLVQERRRLDLATITRLIFTAAGGEIVIDDIRLDRAPKFTTVFPELVLLDAGPAGSPVFDGFLPLTPAMRYTPGRGFGFASGTELGPAEDRRHPDDLFRDWISILKGGLDFDLPDGRYHVWMMIEDPGYWEYYPSWHDRKVLAQGLPILEEHRDARNFLARYYRHDSDEDLPGEDIWERYIKQRYRPVEADVTVENGKLELRFESFGDPHAATLSALVIYPEAKAAMGRRFLEELWAKLKASFNREYRQSMPPPTAGPEHAGNALGGDLSIFVRTPTMDVDAGDRAGPGEPAASLAVRLAKGQIAPLTAALGSRRDIAVTGVRAELPGFDVSAFLVRSKVTRLVQDGSIYSNSPRVLDPLEVSPVRPLRLAAGQTRRLWLDVEPRPETTPGHHSGKLILEFGDVPAVEIPIGAEVYPWNLPPADIPFGYLGAAPRYPETGYPEVTAKRDAEFETGLDMLVRAGMTAVSGGLGGPRLLGFEGSRARLDFTLADQALAAIAGRFQSPALTYDGLAVEGLAMYQPEVPDGAAGRSYDEALRDVLTALAAHGKAKGWPEIVHIVGDEPGDEAIPGTLAVARAFRSSGTGARTAVFTSIGDDASKARHSLAGAVDTIYLNGHSESAIRAILAAGSKCALYNHRNRYERGIYLMKLRSLGCGGHFQFAYSSVHADPWYDLDGREDDQVAVYTHSDGRLRPALDLVRYREAITDYRTLLALERAIAGNSGLGSAKAARTWLTGLLGRMKVGEPASPEWSDPALEALRDTANGHTLAILAEAVRR